MTVINVEVTVAPTNKLPHGTVRRAPAPSFAHAILLDQMGREQCWQVVDVYGPMAVETDVDVQDWPIVYVPAPDEVWQEITPPIPLVVSQRQSGRKVQYCKTCECPEYMHKDKVGTCRGPAWASKCAKDCSAFFPQETP